MYKAIQIPKELEDRNTVLFEKLVPDMGHCDTIEGEMIRAISQVVYRYYNDGDIWHKGYGCETCGPAVVFLLSPICPLFKEMRKGFKKYRRGNRYERMLIELNTKVVEYVESCGEYTASSVDMYDFESKYEEENEYDLDNYEAA